QTLGRLYSSTYYALGDTRTPLRYAIVRVTLTTLLGYIAAVQLPGWIGIPKLWGAAGLTASAGIADWVDMVMLRLTLISRFAQTGLPVEYATRRWLAAFAGAAVAWGIKLVIPFANPIARAAIILTPYGLIFLGDLAAQNSRSDNRIPSNPKYEGIKPG